MTTTLQNVFNRILDRLEFKFFSPYKRKYYALLIRALQFWKMPDYIMDYREAVEFAKHEIKDSHKRIENNERTIERLIEALVDEYCKDSETETEAYREVYQLAYEDELFYDWVKKLPDQYRTKKESDDIFDDQLDAYITSDPIGDADNIQMMNYSLSQLKKGGVYENANR